MSTTQLPETASTPNASWQQGGPSPDKNPDYFTGVPVKRVLAYLVDVVLIAIFASAIAVIAFVPVVLTLGMLKPFVIIIIALVPLGYHTLLIGGDRPATLGMRLLDLEVRTMDGGKPGYIVACFQTIVFYVTVGLTTWLILLVALFNSRHRTLHDFLCGTMVVNTPATTVSAAASQA